MGETDARILSGLRNLQQIGPVPPALQRSFLKLVLWLIADVPGVKIAGDIAQGRDAAMGIRATEATGDEWQNSFVLLGQAF